MKKQKPETTLLLAVDPGATCGYAWKIAGINNESGTSELVRIGGFLENLKLMAQSYGATRVIAIVERSTTKSPRYRAHAADANKVIDAIKRTWPRRNTIHTVDPRTWQPAMLKGAPGADTKAQSIYRARLDGYQGDDHNEADARNLRTYLETTILRGMR